MVIISLDVNRNSLALSYTQLVVELFIFLYNFLERLGFISPCFAPSQKRLGPSDSLGKLCGAMATTRTGLSCRLVGASGKQDTKARQQAFQWYGDLHYVEFVEGEE